METHSDILAMRYARALLGYVSCPSDAAFAVRLGAFAGFMELNRYRFSCADPMVYAEVARSFALDALRVDLMVKLLVERGRISIFPEVMRHVFAIYKRQHQMLFCTLKTSHELTADQKEAIITHIEHTSGKQVLFSASVDRGLIAGIRVEGDEMVWESSVARQLRAIEQLQ
ncbi:MAG: ATP synthase F1 subunit delta [Candidatus Dependentiae bacterium]|nr:ATP synthase F1 subunit delta [Candidatus Dependentiae bacterium]